MFYFYLKAIHIIFVVTWFAALFYMPRLLIYNTEANAEPATDTAVLHKYFLVMMSRLWSVIAWPSAIMTITAGTVLFFYSPFTSPIYQSNFTNFFDAPFQWFVIKYLFVVLLCFYHLFLFKIYFQHTKGIYKFSSMQLRILNEVATIFLVAIVMLAVVKTNISLLWGFVGLILLMVVMMTCIKIYKKIRLKKEAHK